MKSLRNQVSGKLGRAAEEECVSFPEARGGNDNASTDGKSVPALCGSAV
jgi:hypothetical protein